MAFFGEIDMGTPIWGFEVTTFLDHEEGSSEN